jgi:hypothetical protein
VRAARVDVELLSFRRHHQVHVFHRDRADEHVLAHHQRADVAGAVPEAHFERADVGHDVRRAIGQDDFPFPERQ